MKFGSFPIGNLAGAILAHSVSCGNKKLRKGMILSHEDIGLLQGAGITEVYAAILEEGDVHENAAAGALANAICPDPEAAFVTLTDPFTGRVNIVAKRAGVVDLDVERLVRMNQIDPMITLATVPQLQQMQQGGLIGTVKIISYGVNEAHLNAACQMAHDTVRLVRSVLKTATLIVSEIPNGAGEKGVSAIENRLNALNMSLEQVVTVPHIEAPLAEAMRDVESELILILTGSATSDLFDVAPSAVRAAGGIVKRFGLPVDPGNLLFLGALGERPVIGLPGCARSPALNGADWILSRIACGLDVSAQDIAHMSVGGLLKEIPTRPQPRRPKK